MPLPTPRQGESRDQFAARCMGDETMNKEYPDQEQRYAVCMTQWKSKSAQNDQLLNAVRRRGAKNTEWNYGILTADAYVRTLQEHVGIDGCYRFAAKGRTSFDDLLKRAGRTLVYSNADMVRDGAVPQGVELPKNTLMAFTHTLTSSRKDRDGDVLHSDGARPDPKMLLLWQHVHTLPIGKMLTVADQNANRLKVVSCIVDMNELCHDSAVMIDNNMGRFSHGFRALEFSEIKADRDGRGGGFDVRSFEIMEESLVSVPANTDAQVEEVLLGLVEGGKLTSPLMKAVGRGIREHRNVQLPGVTIRYRERVGNYAKELTCGSISELKAAVDAGLIKTKESDNADQSTTGSGASAGGGKDGAGAPKETDDKAGDSKPSGDETGSGDKEMMCTKCPYKGPPGDDGLCPKCGAEMKPAKQTNDKPMEGEASVGTGEQKKEEPTDQKLGRVLSTANESKIRKAMDCHKEVLKLGPEHASRACHALVKEAHGHLDEVVGSLGAADAGAAASEAPLDYKRAAGFILTQATRDEQKRLVELLQVIEAVEQQDRLTGQYKQMRRGGRDGHV